MIREIDPCELGVSACEPPDSEAPAAADRAVERAVARAWGDLLGAAAYADDASWRESGGDSQLELELAYRLERALGRSVPLELFEASMRPSELVDRLRRDRRPDDAPIVAAPRTATIVVLPGILGDEPALADFRKMLGSARPIVTVAYPPWYGVARAGASFAAIVDAVVETIADRASTGPLALVGYSFGGFVAHDVARRLTADGREVPLVALLDSEIGLPVNRAATPRWHGNGVARLRQQVEAVGIRGAIAMRVTYRLGSFLTRCVPARRLVARLGGRLPLPRDVAYALHRVLTLRVFKELEGNHALQPYAGRVTLYRAADEIVASRTRSFEPVAPRLSIEIASGTHFTLITGRSGAELAARIRDALADDG